MSQFKKKITMYASMLALLSLSSAAVYGLPQDNLGATTGYKAYIDQQNNKLMHIDNATKVNGSVVQGDWRTFSVGADEQINFGFSGLSQSIINRVLGGQESQILGKMTNSCINGGTCTSYAQTGKVILINPAGVMFGPGSQVDLNSITTSTFDFKGAKNLQGMSASELNNYQANVLDKLSPTAAVNGENRTYGNITFDRNYKSEFEKAGITNYKDVIALDGTTFDSIDPNTVNKNKSIAFVTDKIDYKDSLLRTGKSLNYGTNNDYSFSNVKLVTADGVTFTYLENGYVNKHVAAEDSANNVVREISIDNSGLDSSTPAIESGDIYIQNKSNAANSNVKIKDTILRGTKLVQGNPNRHYEKGNIHVVGSHDVNIDNSTLETKNSIVNKNGTEYNTYAQDGGEIFILADDNVNLNKSVLDTAGSSNRANTAFNDSQYAGNITIYSYNKDANLNDTRVLASGDVDINTRNNITANNTYVYAKNDKNSSEKNNIIIESEKDITIHNSGVNASGKADIKSVKNTNGTLQTSGNIIISSDLDSNNLNQTVIKGDELSIQAKNTKLDNASLVYKDVKFYNDNTTGTNNLTVANNSTFTPLNADNSFANDINIETNGNLTFDNANVQRAGYTFDLGPNNGTGAGTFSAKSGARANAVNINATSTQGDITVKNSSDIKASKNINMTAQNGNYAQTDSSLTANNNTTVAAAGKINVNNSTVSSVTGNTTMTANGTGDNGNIEINNSAVASGNDTTVKSTKGNKVKITKSNIIAGSDADGFDVVNDPNDNIGNVNIEATKGSVIISDNSTVLSQDKDVNITAYNTITFGNKGADGVTIDNTTDITAQNNVNIKSTNGDINAEKTTMPTITFGNRLAFDAAGDNNFTSADSLKSVNVDYKAGGANKFYTEGDIQFVNSTLDAPNNFVESGHDVILNNLTIKQATTDPKDTTTQIFANGNVTTDNVTNENLNASGPYTYPQSVSTTRTGNGKTTLDVNKTKLKITTETVKDPFNPDNGSITIDVKNADNKNAGVELTAQNVDALDTDPTGGYFKPGYYKSGTQKWDENIDPKQGPEVHLNATDNNISIAKITSDKLTLDPNDNKIADNTNGTPKITVRDQGGLNLDPYMDYNDGDPTGFTYDQNYDTKDINTTGGDLTFDDWSDWKPTGREWYDPDGTKHVEYISTRDGRITDKITTQTDQTHKITFDNNGNPSEFTLVYDKTSTTVEPGRVIKAEDVKNNSTPLPTGTTPEDFIKYTTGDEPCPDVPEIDADSNIDVVRLPREQVEVSRTSRVVDNTADQTSNVMSAAARVDLSSEIDSTYDSDQDDLDE